MNSKVFVALANKKFIEHSKSLFYSAKVDGEWDGDFVLIVPEEDKGTFDENEFTTHGVKIFYGKTLPGNPKPHYYKYYLWTEYFKKWDWIFYCDIDVLFFNKIEFDLDNRQKDILYANDCNGTPLSYQFEYRSDKVQKFSKEQDEKYVWINETWGYWHHKEPHPSFQSCYMLFHKDLIQDSTFNNWHQQWQKRLMQNKKPKEISLKLMKTANPLIIPRNHKVEEALEAASIKGDMVPMRNLLEVLKKPYDARQGITAYQTPSEPSEQIYQTFCGT